MGTATNMIGKYILMLILTITTLFDGIFSPELIPATINSFDE
ncbi:hypothetical protein [uncultured Photobacterium sp.]|nr:hypothetical protein [uncultured Photobacterium sp.]